MPRSASVGGLAKRGVIPRKQFYIKLFFSNTVILANPCSQAISCTAGVGHGQSQYVLLRTGKRDEFAVGDRCSRPKQHRSCAQYQR